MATHEQNIENLRTAVYGEEVRGSMIELFEEDYNLVKNGIGIGTNITSTSSSTTGYSDGNVYINSDTLDIWKLDGSSWVKKGNLKGVSSIDYTQSTADDGYNVLTINLTDGTSVSGNIKNGSRGSTGNGVASVVLQSTSGTKKTYRMTFTDGNYFDWDVFDGGGSAAKDVSYDPTDTGLTATDVQEALDEISLGSTTFIWISQEDYDALPDKTTHNYFIHNANNEPEAGNVGYNNTASGLTATDVQAAIDELKSLIDAI